MRLRELLFAAGLLAAWSGCRVGFDGAPSDPSDGLVSDSTQEVDGVGPDAIRVDGGVPAFVCGNGVIEPARPGDPNAQGEGCDDGEFPPQAGDGCDADCHVEDGWRCEGAPSVCHPRCGDGLLVGAEVCDVGNASGSQGCLPDCSGVVDGWRCDHDGAQGPSVCGAAECGDGIVAGDETCDSDASSCVDCQLDCAAIDEVCDGQDNNCNGEVDEGITLACGAGGCDGGYSYCVAGSLSECYGSAQLDAEICGDGVDNTCDGGTDGSDLSLPCGGLFCPSGEPVCAEPAGCSSTLVYEAETCDDLIDNDCDGLVNEGCPETCIWVGTRQDGTVADDPSGESHDPFGSIQAAIDVASLLDAEATQVCVRCRVGEEHSTYDAVVMAPGVSVVGGFPSAYGTTVACAATVISGTDQPAVLFPSEVGDVPTNLSGFKLERQELTTTEGVSPTVHIRASGARVVDTTVLTPEKSSVGIGVLVSQDATPTGDSVALVARSHIGHGGSYVTVGIFADGAPVEVRQMCDGAPGGEACSQTCVGLQSWGVHVKGAGATNVEPGEHSVAGIVLRDAPGSIIDQASVCATDSYDVAGVVIEGASAGVLVARSAVFARGAANLAAGIAARGCDGSRPRIAYNGTITVADAPLAVGVTATAGCHAQIDHNQLIAGNDGSETSLVQLLSAGVHCGDHGDIATPAVPEAPKESPSLCVIADNRIIGSVGSSADRAIGVACVNSCAAVIGNTVVGNREGSTLQSAHGLQLVGKTPALVDRNRIYGACGAAEAVGVRAVGAQGRLTNNIIIGRGEYPCPLSGSWSTYRGVSVLRAAIDLELDVHSNLVAAGGGGSCDGVALHYDVLAGAGLPDPTAPVGRVLNNILHAGSCGTSAGVVEASSDASPRLFISNLVLASSHYLAGETALDEDAVNGNIWWRYGNMFKGPISHAQIQADPAGLFEDAAFVSSMEIVDAGSDDATPLWDHRGEPRPLGEGPDIGPVEFDPDEPFTWSP